MQLNKKLNVHMKHIVLIPKALTSLEFEVDHYKLLVLVVSGIARILKWGGSKPKILKKILINNNSSFLY